jgi:hypothetical protein
MIHTALTMPYVQLVGVAAAILLSFLLPSDRRR